MKLLGIAIFWTLITGVFVVVVGWGIVQDLRTCHYAETMGQIDRMELNVVHGSKGSTYGVKASYHYLVDGKRYDSTRVRGFEMTTSDRRWPAGVVRRMPAGTQVKVYYDRARPEESVLFQGVMGVDLFMPLFLTPFVCVGVGMWWGVLRGKRMKGIAGLKVREEAEIVRLRPTLWWMGGSALLALGFGSFFLMFLVAIFGGGFSPSLEMVGVAWVLNLVAAAVTSGVVGWKIASGRLDVVLDSARREMRLRRRSFGYQQIERIEAEAGKMQVNGQPTYNVWVMLAGGEKLKVDRWMAHEDAEKLAGYLAVLTGLEAVGENGKVFSATAEAGGS